MNGFIDSYAIDANDDIFLSADGQTRRQKRSVKKAAKKAIKEDKLRQRKASEISSSVNQTLGDLYGVPLLPVQTQPKKSLGSIIRNNREKRQADKLFKSDLERSKKQGTLTNSNQAIQPNNSSSNKKIDLSNVKNTVLGLPALLGLGSQVNESQKTPQPIDSGKTAKNIIIALGAIALVFVLFSKGLPSKQKNL
jgi:hypothetical protein